MCSIHETGLVFVSKVPLEVSSELTLTIQTTVFGLTKDWAVQGWVVECSKKGSDYQITLLFSDLPKGLQQVLALASGKKDKSYPKVPGAPVFGLN